MFSSMDACLYGLWASTHKLQPHCARRAPLLTLDRLSNRAHVCSLLQLFALAWVQGATLILDRLIGPGSLLDGKTRIVAVSDPALLPHFDQVVQVEVGHCALLACWP